MKTQRFQTIETFCFPLVMCFVVLCAVCTAIVQAQIEGSTGFETQLDELLTTVYCYCGCERETIEVCVCPTAQMIETDFRARLNAGETVEQIRTNYLETHGPQFYAVMPAKGINLLAYIMPGVILILIGSVAFTVLRKLRQVGANSESRHDIDRYRQAASQVSDETVKKVETELEKYKQEN